MSTVPYVAGDHDHPEWWTARDDAILAGELAKLDKLPRVALPQRVPAEPERRFQPDTRPPWRLLALLAVVLLSVVLLALVLAAPLSGPAPASVPTTYGPPGPHGGFTSMPVR